MALWDLNRSTADAMPRRVCQLTDAHRTGIWALHELNGQLVTASKDKHAAHSVLSDSRLSVVRRYEMGDFGQLQTCRWRDENVFACAGGSPELGLVDVRARHVSRIPCGPDGTIVTTVRWSPSDAHLLLASGSDSAMRLFDVRSPSVPLMELKGHSRKSNEKARKIYKPSFSHGGRAVSAVGHGSNKLSVFALDEGGRRASEGKLLENVGSGGGASSSSSAARDVLETGCTLQAVNMGGAVGEVLVLAHGLRVEAYVPRKV